MSNIPRMGAPVPRTLKGFLRYFGAMLVGAGVILTVIGVYSRFSSWNVIGASRYFWAAFLGLPLIAIGSFLNQSANVGVYRRFSSGELTLDAEELDDRTSERPMVKCERCQTLNAAIARFCNQCGIALAALTCLGCGAEVTPGARFCHQCGKPLE
jgi:hypothetical protein